MKARRHARRSLSAPVTLGPCTKGVSALSRAHANILPVTTSEGECLHEVHWDLLHKESACRTASRARRISKRQPHHQKGRFQAPPDSFRGGRACASVSLPAAPKYR